MKRRFFDHEEAPESQASLRATRWSICTSVASRWVRPSKIEYQRPDTTRHLLMIGEISESRTKTSARVFKQSLSSSRQFPKCLTRSNLMVELSGLTTSCESSWWNDVGADFVSDALKLRRRIKTQIRALKRSRTTCLIGIVSFYFYYEAEFF